MHIPQVPSLHSRPPRPRGAPATAAAAVRIFTCQSCDNSGQFKGKEHVLRPWLFPEVEHGKNMVTHTVTIRQHPLLCPSSVSPGFPVCLLSCLSVPTPNPRSEPAGWVSPQLFPGLEVAWYHLVPGLFLPQTWRNYIDLEGHGQQLTSVFRSWRSTSQNNREEGEVS